MSHIKRLPAEVLRLVIAYLDRLNWGKRKLSNLMRKPRLARLVLRHSPALLDLSIFNAAAVCKQWQNVVFEVLFEEDTHGLTLKDWQHNVMRMRDLEVLCREACQWLEPVEPLKQEIEIKCSEDLAGSVGCSEML